MANVDYFLKLEGIEGESTDDKHKNEIDVLSYSWGATQSGTAGHGGGGGAGKVSMQDFQFTMRVNKATPKLMLACATGQHLPEAKLVCRKAGGEQEEYMAVTMSDLLVSSYQTGGSAGDAIPIESITLNFSTIEVEYKSQKPDGTLDSPVKVGYDLKANKKI
ncbi:MAG: Hcp family type VI secretion system effector [Longimicrobiales bacterium]